MEREALAGIRIHVHASGDRDLDGILRLIEASSRAVPIEDKLGQMCADVARIADVEVVSVYVRERAADSDLLVMRGNVGFPAGSVGNACLRLGEGITGFVAECLRPVSAAIAEEEEHYVPIPDLGEERFPAFLGVPLTQGGESVGVLVLQRSESRVFTAEEVILATALAAPFAAAIDLERRRGRGEPNGRSVRLRGLPVVQGAAMGRAIALPSLSALKGSAPTGAIHPSPAVAAIGGLESLQRDLERAQKKLRGATDPDVERALANLKVVSSDRRFRDRLEAETAQRGLVGGLERVARDYARVPYLVGSQAGDLQAVLAERAQELEDLCVLILARARDHQFLEPGAVLVTQRLGSFAALAAASRGVKAIVVEDPLAASGPAVAIAAAAEIPLVSEVTGLFAWVRNRDLVVVNARGGSVDINPSVTAVARFRSGARG